MNITKILCKLLELLGQTADGFLNSDSAYKAVIKQIRLKLKQLHPDAGGDSNEFNQLYKVYETLLVYKKQVVDYELEIKKSLTYLSKNLDSYKNDNTTFGSVSFDDVLNAHIIMPTKRNWFVQTTISELVLHFNRLSYCQAQEQMSLLHDLVTIPIKLTAVEPTSDDKTETTTVELTRAVRHDLSGQYKFDVDLELKAGSTLKVEVPGFEQIRVLDITDTSAYKIVFDENMVKLTIVVAITVI